jgi:hypothetical protein
MGDQLAVPRTIEHSAEFGKRKDADRADEDLRAIGYIVALDRRGLTKVVCCRLSPIAPGYGPVIPRPFKQGAQDWHICTARRRRFADSSKRSAGELSLSLLGL